MNVSLSVSLAICKVLFVPRSPRGRDSLLPVLQQAAAGNSRQQQATAGNSRQQQATAGTSRYQQAEISSVGTSRHLQATPIPSASSPAARQGNQFLTTFSSSPSIKFIHLQSRLSGSTTSTGVLDAGHVREQRSAADE
jgi:hypothetical protein